MRIRDLVLFLHILLTASLAGAQFQYTVENTLDLPDTNLEDYQCLASNGACTLRAAVEQLNYIDGILPEIDFLVPGMVFSLDEPLTVSADITFVGFGSNATTIDGNGGLAMTVYGDVTLEELTMDSGLIWVTTLAGLTATNCVFKNGVSTGTGGAINYGGRFLSITGCEFYDNQAAWGGGAIYATGVDPSSQITISDSLFHNNQAGEEGGAISSRFSLDISDSDLYQNTAGFDGGAIFFNGLESELTIGRCNIYGNVAANGGGIAIDGESNSTVGIVDSAIFSNQTTGDGGGVVSRGDEVLHVLNSTISGNSAEENGGGLAYLASSASATISSTTITANTADNGGTNNDGNGGGVYSAAGSGVIELRNSIVAGNDDASTGLTGFFAPDCDATLSSYGYNLVGATNLFCTVAGDATGNLVGSTAEPIDPELGILIRPVYLPTFSHGLAASSPAVDAGNPAGCISFNGTFLATDQVGYSRMSGLRCDMGSREYMDPSFIFVHTFESGDVTGWTSLQP